MHHAEVLGKHRRVLLDHDPVAHDEFGVLRVGAASREQRGRLVKPGDADVAEHHPAPGRGANRRFWPRFAPRPLLGGSAALLTHGHRAVEQVHHMVAWRRAGRTGMVHGVSGDVGRPALAPGRCGLGARRDANRRFELG